MSSGRAARPNRPASRSSTTSSASASPATTLAVMPLTVAPGAIALTARRRASTPQRPRRSSRRPRASPRCTRADRGRTDPAVLAVFTIEPEPCARMIRAPCLIPRNTLVSRMAMVRSQSARSVSTSEPVTPEHTRVIEQAIQAPELRDGIVDHSSHVRPRRSRQPSGTGQRRRDPATARPRSSRTSARTHCAPSPATRRAMPSPIPPDAPVTTATLPSNRALTAPPSTLSRYLH